MMMKWTMLFASVVVLAAAFRLGCNPPAETPAGGDEGPADTATDHEEDADHEHEEDGDHEHEEDGDHEHEEDGDHEHEEDGDHAGHEHGKYEAALAELTDEDHALAEKQKDCPVSDDPLGSMGKPYKVLVEDQPVFLCCQGCEQALLDDPDKYLAKLKEE